MLDLSSSDFNVQSHILSIDGDDDLRGTQVLSPQNTVLVV